MVWQIFRKQSQARRKLVVPKNEPILCQHNSKKPYVIYALLTYRNLGNENNEPLRLNNGNFFLGGDGWGIILFSSVQIEELPGESMLKDTIQSQQWKKTWYNFTRCYVKSSHPPKRKLEIIFFGLHWEKKKSKTQWGGRGKSDSCMFRVAKEQTGKCQIQKCCMYT